MRKFASFSPHAQKARDRAMTFLETISKNLENDDPQLHIERSIRMHIQEVIDAAAEKRRVCAELDADKQTLSAKISKKQEELERQEKRLKSLTQVRYVGHDPYLYLNRSCFKMVFHSDCCDRIFFMDLANHAFRPAFMEEYEALEQELKGVYEVYIERFRNLHYLEAELAQHQRAELEKKEESDRALKRLQKKCVTRCVCCQRVRVSNHFYVSTHASIVTAQIARRRAAHSAR